MPHFGRAKLLLSRIFAEKSRFGGSLALPFRIVSQCLRPMQGTNMKHIPSGPRSRPTAMSSLPAVAEFKYVGSTDFQSVRVLRGSSCARTD
jgi:hypothetical protein